MMRPFLLFSKTINRSCWRHSPKRGLVTQLLRPKNNNEELFLQAKIEEYDKKRAHPLSLEEMLQPPPLEELNELLREEYCIRCAERICMMQERIPNFREIGELREAYTLFLDCFRRMQCERALDDFTPVVRQIVERCQPIVPLISKGMFRLVQKYPSMYNETFINTFMNELLLSRLGSNVLMSQYLSVRGAIPTSIVDPHCNVTAICGDAARRVQQLCAKETGFRPTIKVESHSSIENDPQEVTASFCFIPGALSYILQELLKNSAVATAKKAKLGNKSRHDDTAISVVVCADETRVMIHIGDKGGGIPFDVGQHIWSYMYTTKKRQQGTTDLEQSGATPLGGFGVGLPLSRLYASYLGGSINLVSLPGYGTHAYVLFPRLPENLVEVVPERDHSYDWNSTKSYGEFIF